MSLLCLDVRNSQTVIGVFDGDRLTARWRVATLDTRTADEWQLLLRGMLAQRDLGRVDAVALACTVPAVLHELRLLLERDYADCAVSIIEPGTRTGVAILMDNPREVGADRIVNAAAAGVLYPDRPSIVVDLGTATTFDVVDAQGRYVGGAISAGIGISLEALARRGAQLRSVELVRPRGVVAKNTVEAIQSGMVFGFAGLVDGIVTRMVRALGTDDVAVVATGTHADVVLGECARVTAHEPDLTLIGLRIVAGRNA
ncbi:type III pantothenate kinase [Mumia sp. zg.B53]|uniref:type III pantothenate kinase n=1 Tax=unclassified Mumia TaxID=2621872 RepID=UPI001C6EA188|nr:MULTISPECIES: type III pantothenate kinase [unclassified Mumia]MBW9209486.1 type III pantothenate kinase [Mumia sp. zg.B21]MBW9214110.1 type III pantothenate kinase [Mumia sp. zg.B53]